MRALRLAVILFMAATALAVIPGEGSAIVPGGVDKIAFASNFSGSYDINTRDFDGNSPLPITATLNNDTSPAWSPDGQQILFSRSVSMGFSDVYVMDSDGANPINLSQSSSAVEVAHGWSPDGLWVLFSSNADLWVMRPDGSERTSLTLNSPEEWTASWSPDGSTIAFDRQGDLYLIDADGTNERPLLLRPEHDTHPTWSPNGEKIAFVSAQGVADNIWIMDAGDPSHAFSLTNTALSQNTDPAWAPDGSRIGFSSDRAGNWDIWMMNPDGTDIAQLTQNPAADERFVAWESSNRSPMPMDDTGSFVYRGQEVVIDVLGNDSDPDGEPLTVTDITRMPAEGTVVINPAGTVTYMHDGPRRLPLTDSFDYKVEDTRLGSATATVSVEIYPYFDDVPFGHLFFDEVLWLATQRITFGCDRTGGTLFCPDDPVTRGQMAAFLVRARGYTAVTGPYLFVDTTPGVFSLDINKLATAGVTRGCNPPVNDRFCPNEPVTRGQMAAFLVRAFNLVNLGLPDRFVDDDGSIFETDIDAVGATGVSRGCNPPVNDQFCPHAYVTRQQMAAFLYRAVTQGEE